MSSTLKKDYFDYMSDELFTDEQNENKNCKNENPQPVSCATSEISQVSSYDDQRMQEKKRLYEIYMSDPTIPKIQKNPRHFMMTLFQPQYETQRIYELRKKCLKQKLKGAKVEPQYKQPAAVVDPFGYDDTFIATREELIDHQKRLADIPQSLKEMYNSKGIVTASQVYKIEQISNKESSKAKRDELSQSLLELSITMTEQYEIAQAVNVLENDLDESLNELTEKLQTSAKAAKLIDYTITSSQRLKLLDEINTCDFTIKTCDIFSDEEQNQPEQQSDLPNDLNANIESFKAPGGFTLASGKSLAVNSLVFAKFKNIFDDEDQNANLNASTSSQATVQNKKINVEAFESINSGGYTFASGKQRAFSSTKLDPVQKTFEEEEVKAKILEIGSQENLELSTSQSKCNSHEKSNQVLSTFKKQNNKSRAKTMFSRKPKSVTFDEISIEKNTSNSMLANNTNEPPVTVGFSFASGKRVTLNNQVIDRFRLIFDEEERKLHDKDSKNECENFSLDAPERSTKPMLLNVPKISLPVNESPYETPKFLKKMSNEFVEPRADKTISKVATINKHDVVESELLINTQTLKEIENIESNHASLISNTSNTKIVKNNSVKTPEKSAIKNLCDDEFYISPSPPRKVRQRKKKFKLNLSRMNNDENSSEWTERDNESLFKVTVPTTCAFTFASGKDVKINQSKVNSFKRKFEELNESEEKREASFKETTNAQPTKCFRHDESFEEQPATNESLPRATGDSGLSLNSFRMNSLRAKMPDEADVFNFKSMRTRKNSQVSIPSKNLKVRSDSGIESQERLTNKLHSPPKPVLNKNLFFAPSFTSSPVVNQPASRLNNHGTSNRPVSLKRKALVNDQKNSQVPDDNDDDDDYVPFQPVTTKILSNVNEAAISPINRPKSKAKKVKCTERQPLQQTVSRMLFEKKTLSQRLADFDDFMSYHSQLELFGNDPTATQLNSIAEVERAHNSKYEVEQRVKNERKEAFKEQLDYIYNKPEEDSRQMTGTMFMMKSGKNRKRLKDFVENEKPMLVDRHEITPENVMDFKFDMTQFVEDVTLKVSITLADNAKLILDENSKVGFQEIKNSFLASYGVDPNLVKNGWIENAYKMIVFKLLWMENLFRKFEKYEVFSPENILLQLKYRYDREIDRHQRPALRKITEKDEPPNRRMILRVMEVVYTIENGFELDLSDGWYKIRTCIDSCLAEALSKKKIVVGTKLIVCGAELINVFDTGHSPLELPRGVRLKIHGNSTRLAPWDEKLGFSRNPCSLVFSLNAVSHDGGAIGRLRVFIVHIYSMIYVESNGEKKEFRSEKMQNRFENQKEILYSTMYEKIHMQVIKEAHKELKARVSKIDKSRVNLDKMSIHEICDLLEYENDSDLAFMIKNQLTMLQKEQIYDIYNQRKFELNQKVKERIITNEKSVAQLLKFRVVDAINPKSTALVSWWQPSEDLLDIIKVGNLVEMRKLTSAGKFSSMSTGEIQIHADKGTSIKQLQPPVDSGKFQKFIRCETRFPYLTKEFDPLNGEFDIACMIVFVEEKQAKEKFQKVYVTNERSDFVVINFYPNITECAYDDVLIEGKLLYIRNLQWRHGFQYDVMELPEAYSVIDSTIFISNPKDENQRRRLDEISSSIGDHKEYLQKCREKLISFGINCNKRNDELLKTIHLNFPSAVSPKSRSKKRNLGMRRVPIKYRFS